MVIVLGAEMKLISGTTTRVFASPTVVHFCATLLLSAILSAPWQEVSIPAVCLAACAVVGIAYVAVVLRDIQRQKAYVPVVEDWLWHVALPALAYGALLVSAITLPLRTAIPLFAVGASPASQEAEQSDRGDSELAQADLGTPREEGDRL